jgi:hypothetical protein
MTQVHHIKKAKEHFYQVSVHIYHNGKESAIVNSYVYLLGMLLNSNGKCLHTQKRLAMSSLINSLKQLYVTKEQQMYLFDSMVGSVLGYASEIWGFHRARSIDFLMIPIFQNVVMSIIMQRKMTQVHHIKKAKEHFYQVSVHIYKNDCAESQCFLNGILKLNQIRQKLSFSEMAGDLLRNIFIITEKNQPLLIHMFILQKRLCRKSMLLAR